MATSANLFLVFPLIFINIIIYESFLYILPVLSEKDTLCCNLAILNIYLLFIYEYTNFSVLFYFAVEIALSNVTVLNSLLNYFIEENKSYFITKKNIFVVTLFGKNGSILFFIFNISSYRFTLCRVCNYNAYLRH